MIDWKAYEDAERTASNAYDAEGLNYPVPEQIDILRAIKRAVLMERERCAEVADGFAPYSYAHEVATAIRSPSTS